MRILGILMTVGLLLLSGANHAASDGDYQTGYEIDGRTSASVLAAKRSHTVSDQDQTLLSAFSGLLVIGVVVFFIQTLNRK